MKSALAVGTLLLACLALPASADNPTWLTAVQDQQLAQADAPKADAPKPAAVEQVQKEKVADARAKCPFRFAIDYTLISDYIFRGVNISEYPGEGRERPNHQMNVNVEFDLKEYGAFGSNFWMELFGANLGGDGDFKQLNYDVYYRYKFSDIGVSVTGGWIARTFPVFSGDAYSTYEVYAIVAYDDGKLFGTKKNVLNPYLAYYHDLDLAEDGSWWELGISHVFDAADCGMGDVAVLKDFSLIPSLVYGIQHNYYGKLDPTRSLCTSAVNILFGLEIAYDLTSALNIPAEYGKLTLSGLLYYSQALDHALVNDEFFGGMKVGYKW